MPESDKNSGSARDAALRPLIDRRLCVAPMMEWTDRHFRNLARIIAPRALLYTEMVVDAAIEHGDRQRLLAFHEGEHPLALQLGGSDPQRLARAAASAAKYGYDEINLNVGCPSGRVQQGRFGACLMAEPALVADCVAAIGEAVDVPVTVKTRIGIDDYDSYDFLHRFADAVISAGSAALVVHARKAWLSGLSPKQNREVPPLDYRRVERLAAAFPGTPVVVNGGVTETDQAHRLLQRFSGVMIGRAAYHRPLLLARLQKLIDPTTEIPTPQQVLQCYLPYIDKELERGTRLHNITRHMMGLFQGRPGARHWRRQLSLISTNPDMGLEYLQQSAAGAADAA